MFLADKGISRADSLLRGMYINKAIAREIYMSFEDTYTSICSRLKYGWLYWLSDNKDCAKRSRIYNINTPDKNNKI